MQEEQLKNEIANKWFSDFDTSQIIGAIDFCISDKRNNYNYLWTEAKKSSVQVDIMLAQLIITIGKARTFDKYNPPAFLGCFDKEKIAFIEYHKINHIFYKNDFNWNVTPSNRNTKEFAEVLELVKDILEKDYYLFYYDKNEKELKQFIKNNFNIQTTETSKILIDKNNFNIVYHKWYDRVKDTIAVDWDKVRKAGIIDADFYLADLLSENNLSLKDKLNVVLEHTKYKLNRGNDEFGFISYSDVPSIDEQKAHKQFWNIYERPPKEEYWDYIIKRRDLLVPQDIRERKGSFYTPQIWVELAQKYLADVFGENWQDEYYIWDCAAGTGNLLAGLTNKYNIYASTIDQADVDVMHDRIANGANLLMANVFKFDFLNDEFDKLPVSLQKIIKEEPHKLIIFINPPYAEAGNTATNKSKSGVATTTKIRNIHKDKLGLAIRELYAQFFIRIYFEISNCKLATFGTLKYISGDGFKSFREHFQAKFLKGFCVPADTFDNVFGKFPVGFAIWNTEKKQKIKKCEFVVYNTKVDTRKEIKIIKKIEKAGKKVFYSCDGIPRITTWITSFDMRDKNGNGNCNEGIIGYTGNHGPDFQTNVYVHINSIQKINKNNTLNNATKYSITRYNLIPVCIYFSVRKVIKATWLNDRDQFLYPNDKWKEDLKFQNDCLTYTLFHNSNNIQSKYGVNHWIPFTEYEVDAKAKFESHFMVDFIAGKITTQTSLYESIFSLTTPTLLRKATPPQEGNFKNEAEQTCSPPVEGWHLQSKCRGGLFKQNESGVVNEEIRTVKLKFSDEAKAVFDIGRDLWKYYHTQLNINVNASLYEIREYFQGRNEKTGKMNNKSVDQKYNLLLANLRNALDILAEKIEPKVYEYGFLLKSE